MSFDADFKKVYYPWCKEFSTDELLCARGWAYALLIYWALPPSFKEVTLFSLPKFAFVPNFLNFSQNTHFCGRSAAKGLFFREFWAQKAIHVGDTYPYLQRVMNPRTFCSLSIVSLIYSIPVVIGFMQIFRLLVEFLLKSFFVNFLTIFFLFRRYNESKGPFGMGNVFENGDIF